MALWKKKRFRYDGGDDDKHTRTGGVERVVVFCLLSADLYIREKDTETKLKIARW